MCAILESTKTWWTYGKVTIEAEKESDLVRSF